MPQSKNDPNVDKCVLWMGSRGNYNLVPLHLRNSIEKERSVNAKMRYFQDGKHYSARNVAFAYFRPNDVTEKEPGDKSRLRLKSICKRPDCVNPWHHYHGDRRIHKKRPTKMAEKLLGSSAPIVTPVMSDSAYKKTLLGRIDKNHPHR